MDIESYRGNQVRMRSLGKALIQHDWSLYKKEKVGHKTGYTHGRHGGKDRVNAT